MPEIVTLYSAHLQPARGIWKHFAHLAMMTLTFLVLASLAVYYALGFQLNWQTHRIQQTGSLYINIRNNVPAQIFINGQLQSGNQPLTVSHVFPGQYALLVTADGYQSFERLVDVTANTVSAVHNLVLIKKNPQNIQVDASWVPLQPVTPDTRAVVRSSNELWIDNKFVTRTSQDITQVRFYVDNRHVIYQEAGALWLLDIENISTELLLSGIGDSVLPYNFENGGQILVYQVNGGITKAISLY